MRRREQEPSTPSIENAFAKLKALLRAKGERTITALWNAIGSVLDLFTPAECANYFKAAFPPALVMIGSYLSATPAFISGGKSL